MLEDLIKCCKEQIWKLCATGSDCTFPIIILLQQIKLYSYFSRKNKHNQNRRYSTGESNGLWGCTCYKLRSCLICKFISVYCGIPQALPVNAGTEPHLDYDHFSPNPLHFMDPPTILRTLVWISTMSQCESLAVLLMFSAKCDQ